MNRTTLFKLLILTTLITINVLYFLHPITLVTSDLGRHLTNGKLFIEQGIIPTTNLYSYTAPNFPFINHHWASGALFYLIERSFGFVGLSLFLIGMSLSIFFLFFDCAKRESNFFLSAFCSLLVLPLIGLRTEVRPELFSYLFTGIFLWILVGYSKQNISKRWLFILPILELFWVNLHVYFPIGLIILGSFCVDALFKKTSSVRVLVLIVILTSVATFLNPFGFQGVLYPFQIFKNYDFAVLENESVIESIQNIFYIPSYYFLFLVSILIGSYVYSFQKKSISLWHILITLFFLYVGFNAIRNFALFGYVVLFLMASNLKKFSMQKKHFIILITIGIIYILFLKVNPYLLPSLANLQLGIDQKGEKAAQFFKDHSLKGPIFNNYDNGGYLIYHLYPKEKVFVDNRPEAYPPDFFKKTFIQAQLGAKWAHVNKKYGINAIFFHRNDASVYGRNFLRSRIFDSTWALVYKDESSVIFLKRNVANLDKIKELELPKEL